MPEPYSQQQHRATRTLQQWFRSWGGPKKKKKKKKQQQKSQAFRWPTIFELRGLYLDPDAVAAGATDSEMYSDEALREREKLRSSPEVCILIPPAHYIVHGYRSALYPHSTRSAHIGTHSSRSANTVVGVHTYRTHTSSRSAHTAHRCWRRLRRRGRLSCQRARPE